MKEQQLQEIQVLYFKQQLHQLVRTMQGIGMEILGKKINKESE
jgi:hypothetical protein